MKNLINKIETYFDMQKSIPTKYPFVMHAEEKELFKKYLADSKNYLEFGTGGSTLFSLIHSEVQVTTVDTNWSWLNFIKKYKIIKTSIGDRLNIHYVDIGKTKSWGYPVDESEKDKFPEFSSSIFKENSYSTFDLVLIDGRFRVACTLQTILNCFENKDLKILIHDYSLRDSYIVVEEFLDVIESDGTLYVFKIKENVDLSRVQDIYEQTKYIAD